ncbi:hypothetical protein FIM12_03265 [SAR202 cluster bacterium AD-804-J14_MRT_500m]|nr:hypothetical protein [SAR202 cluster bacterium AD-804-J14_MRT_500m]
MANVFDGIVVLDLSRGQAASVATMIMSDFGADVIKVEPPGGDPFRSMPGAIQWNRGKRSVILDLKTPNGKKNILQLVQQSDVFVENMRPGATQRLGLDYATLSANRPTLVYLSHTGFGPSGPYSKYKGYDAVVAAKSGRMMMFSGQNQRDGPNFTVVKSASHAATMAIVRGIIAALYVRDRTGQGQKVETSMLKSITTYDHCSWIQGQMLRKDPVKYSSDIPIGISRPNPHGYLAARTKDGYWIQLANIMERLFRAEIKALGLDYIYNDPRFDNAPFISDANRSALEDLILARVQQKTLQQWMDIFTTQTSDVAAEPFMNSYQGLSHSQIIHNGHIQTITDTVVGESTQLGSLVVMSQTPGRTRRPSPLPGEHTAAVLSRLQHHKNPAYSRVMTPLPKFPLEDVLVLDLSTVINGPLSCSLIAELGARVIRVEPPAGDYIRTTIHGLAAQRTMAGTEDICLNLKTKEGQTIVRQLAAKADILLHSMRPGAPERTGIGFEELSLINPNLVYVYAGGYGYDGPHSNRPSMAPIPGAVCGGAISQMGRDSLPSPDENITAKEVKELSRKLGRANDGTTDHNSSMGNSVAMLLGLYARERTGKGQYILSTMLGNNAYANVDDFFWHDGKPERLLPDNEGFGLNALYRLYRAKGGWVFLACLFEPEWHDLCRGLGRRDLISDVLFSNPSDRKQNDAVLAQELSSIFLSHEPLYWEKMLADLDVACVRAEDQGMFHFFDQDPHVKVTGMLTRVETKSIGPFWRYSPIVSFSHTGSKAEAGPLKGQNSTNILEELGYTKLQIADFKGRGVIDWDPEC